MIFRILTMNTPTPYFLPTALYGTKVHCAVPLVPLLEKLTMPRFPSFG